MLNFCTSDAVACHTQSFCKVLLWKGVYNNVVNDMAKEVKIVNDSMTCLAIHYYKKKFREFIK